MKAGALMPHRLSPWRWRRLIDERLRRGRLAPTSKQPARRPPEGLGLPSEGANRQTANGRTRLRHHRSEFHGCDYNRKGSGFAERLRYLDIKLTDWLFRAIEASEVLPISRDYFRLRSPLDRR